MKVDYLITNGEKNFSNCYKTQVPGIQNKTNVKTDSENKSIFVI